MAKKILLDCEGHRDRDCGLLRARIEHAYGLGAHGLGAHDLGGASNHG